MKMKVKVCLNVSYFIKVFLLKPNHFHSVKFIVLFSFPYRKFSPFLGK